MKLNFLISVIVLSIVSCTMDDTTDSPNQEVVDFPNIYGASFNQNTGFYQATYNSQTDVFSSINLLADSDIGISGTGSYFNEYSVSLFNSFNGDYYIKNYNDNNGVNINITPTAIGDMQEWFLHSRSTIVKLYGPQDSETVNILFKNRITEEEEVINTIIDKEDPFRYTFLSEDYYIVQSSANNQSELFIFDVDLKSYLGSVILPFSDAVDNLNGIIFDEDSFLIIASDTSIYEVDITNLSMTTITSNIDGEKFIKNQNKLHYIFKQNDNFIPVIKIYDFESQTESSVDIAQIVEELQSDLDATSIEFKQSAYSVVNNSWIFWVKAIGGNAQSQFFLNISLNGDLLNRMEVPDVLKPGEATLFVD